eukprot:CAMPEP_0185726850 /NCGR_PEP_ID=MMETSP1171-20130828/2706_1 /TAXON_ID=374046 /ORGANISM="Helicotheca tamensis, Strain CCMP826" /LENGTH=367 /DNA_ID=CAMNT_0028395285 /DNA_START=60 /DNA_END=1166 /DNA_ORIENTATION=-
MSLSNMKTVLACLFILLLSHFDPTNAYLGTSRLSTSRSFRRPNAITHNPTQPSSVFSRKSPSLQRDHHTPCNLVPITEFNSDVSFLSSPESYRACIDEAGRLRGDYEEDNTGQDPYILCIAEEDDLPDISQLTVEAFDATAIVLGGDLSGFEKALLEPSVGMWNAYTGVVAYAEVLQGLRSRMKDRLHKVTTILPPRVAEEDVSASDATRIAANSSLILAMARPKQDGQKGIDVVATVELRLQPTDAKIPFSQPWLDSMERKIAKAAGLNASTRDKTLQPYLSNLCVSEELRGRRLGKALVRCVENIATETWGYSKLYLHVDLDNVAALNLYRSEGFKDVGFRWNPFWAGKAAEIGYFVKSYGSEER